MKPKANKQPKQKKPSERAFKHTIFSGPYGGAGANTLAGIGARFWMGKVQAWRKEGEREVIAKFETVTEAEIWLTENGRRTTRFFTPALTLIRKGGGISGFALWDAKPMSEAMHAYRTGSSMKIFAKMHDAKTWLEDGPVKGRVDEAPLSADAEHEGVQI